MHVPLEKLNTNLSKHQRQLLHAILTSSLIALGIGLRFIYSENYPFGFDQVQILENAWRISQGNMTLIGPRTGPAEMFTGPLIYYFTVPFVWLLKNPTALIYTTVMISAITGISLSYVSKRAFGKVLALGIIALWAASPFLVKLDRITWNPNLMLLAASLVYFSFQKIIRDSKTISVIDIVLLSLGVFLGYQAHFSGLLLLPLVILGWLIFVGRRFLLLLIPIISFFVSLVPTIIFDLRHSGLNAKGLLALVANKEAISRFDSLARLKQALFITIENMGKILFQDNPATFILSTGLILIILFIVILIIKKWDNQQTKHNQYFAIFWLMATVGVFSLYRGKTPEYYYLIELPALLHIAAAVINHILTVPQKIIWSIVWTAYSLFISFKIAQQQPQLSIGSQVAAASYLNNLSQNNNLGAIIFDMEPNNTYGLAYLTTTIKTSTSAPTVHLVYPYRDGNLITHVFNGGFGAWIDPRTNISMHYVSQPDYLIASPNDITIYQNHYPIIDKATQQYVVFRSSGERIASLEVSNRNIHPTQFQKIENDILSQTTTKLGECVKQWCEINPANNQALYQAHQNKLFIWKYADDLPNNINIHDQVEIITNYSEKQ